MRELVRLEVSFDNQRFGRVCESDREIRKKVGVERAKKISLRIKQLKAADTLADLRQPGFGRCHELTEDRAGLLSLDLDGPYRLLIRPADEDNLTPDGGLDWGKVTAVVVVGVQDPH